MSKVIVIGVGFVGMMVVIEVLKNYEVILLDGNERIGKKFFIIGKGRCNVINVKDILEFFEYILGNLYFLYSLLYSFINDDIMNFFEKEGIELKVERGDRVFLEFDKFLDIICGLLNVLSRINVKIRLNLKVIDVKFKDKKIIGFMINNEESLVGDYYIMVIGGVLYFFIGFRGEG